MAGFLSCSRIYRILLLFLLLLPSFVSPSLLEAQTARMIFSGEVVPNSHSMLEDQLEVVELLPVEIYEIGKVWHNDGPALQAYPDYHPLEPLEDGKNSFSGKPYKKFVVYFCRTEYCRTTHNIPTDLGVKNFLPGRRIFVHARPSKIEDDIVYVRGTRVLLQTEGAVSSLSESDEPVSGAISFDLLPQLGALSTPLHSIVCLTTQCLSSLNTMGYPNAVIADLQTSSLIPDKNLSVIGYEKENSSGGGLEFGTVWHLANPIRRGAAIVTARNDNTTDYYTSDDTLLTLQVTEGPLAGTSVEARYCVTSDCRDLLSSEMWGEFMPDLRAITRFESSPDVGDTIQFAGEELGIGTYYLHAFSVSASVSCDEKEKLLQETRTEYKSVEKQWKAANKRYTRKEKKMTRQINKLNAIRDKKLSAFKEVENTLLNRIPTLTEKCENGLKKACRKKKKAQRRLTKVQDKITQINTTIDTQIARLESSLEKQHNSLGELTTKKEELSAELQQREDAMQSCQ
jgi:hypothetical protein